MMDQATPFPGFPTPASRQPAAEQAAEGVAGMLRLARGMVKAGRRVQLDGLDQMVGRLCARCLDLPPEEGRALRPHLAALLVEIDALHSALAQHPPP